MINHNYTGKKILIIGGTGTIGRSLVKRLMEQEPSVIRIFSRDEHKQYEMSIEFKEQLHRLRFLIGDIRDQQRLVRAMEDIDYVFHVAAMKHVPSCEYNPFEAVQTNVIGTQNVIHAAIHNNVKKVIFTSTDKAISPTNTYGASKLMAERLITAAQHQTGPKKTKFAAVRFGNVMGSRGSVIPLFKQQIQTQRKITVTCREMTRFMMTLKQATDLTIKAMDVAQGGETFVLKMPVVRLMDLAHAVIERTSKSLNIDPNQIRIEDIGLRPGEKMYEELMTEEESAYALETDDMFIVRNSYLEYQQQENAWPADIKSYSSNEVEPIAKEKLNSLLDL
ncbi:polysaccharide biosynthesis protein [Paenibacillus sp. Marseille-P2973]|uniref:UDP-N-acetylglucosamine 4,6-dehydratase family protein n=1 Tax=Paenibacillus sp. Marseille-P2973 TaxID=1871032 RepID=UPI001B388EF2|nr:UDP-N-acetylglucosamine 4,6-dehydratase family protein [Paenibacillus sp. Marseille-P2973]MBQ4900013.1 polysaccharide biosynthesis protein [Paenibacillus sp. Marseille-P2973]